MDDYNKIYKSICRVCVTQSTYEDMVRLFDKTKSDGISSYGKLVTTFANIHLKTDDNLPDMMCKNCLSMLKQAVLFKYTCENSDSQLKNLMEYTDSTTNDYKEIICQYTIFRHYFPEECTSEASRRVTVRKEKSKSTKKFNRPVETKLENKSDYKLSLLFDSDVISHQDYGPDGDDNLETYKNDTGSDSESKSDKSDPSPQYIFLDALKKPSNAQLTANKKIKDGCEDKLQQKDSGKYAHSYCKKDFTCNICNIELTSRVVYERHMQKHNGCKYMCESCGKAFPTNDELNVHQVLTHGYGPHLKCSYCSYKAPRKHYLTEHVRLHTGERPFTCEKCGLTFRRKALWKKHLVYHDEKSLQCPHCPKKFYHHYPLSVHMNNIHERLYLYMCRQCGATYAKAKTVRQHMTNKHGIPRMLQGKVIRVMKTSTTNLTENCRIQFNELSH